MSKKTMHIGFKAAAKNVAAREGIPLQNANAIIASASRGASPAAKRANKNLKRVR
jgi:hypothetical protein